MNVDTSMVFFLDAKVINVTQPIWSSGCPTWAQRRAEKSKKCIFNSKLSLCWTDWQPNRLGHINILCINLFNPRTNSWNFVKKKLRIGGLKISGIFWVGFFDFFLFKSVNIFNVARRMGSKKDQIILGHFGRFLGFSDFFLWSPHETMKIKVG